MNNLIIYQMYHREKFNGELQHEIQFKCMNPPIFPLQSVIQYNNEVLITHCFFYCFKKHLSFNTSTCISYGCTNKQEANGPHLSPEQQ